MIFMMHWWRMTPLAIKTECLATLEHSYVTLVACPANLSGEDTQSYFRSARPNLSTADINLWNTFLFFTEGQIRALLKTQSYVFGCWMRQIQWQEMSFEFLVNMDTKVSIGRWWEWCFVAVSLPRSPVNDSKLLTASLCVCLRKQCSSSSLGLISILLHCCFSGILHKWFFLVNWKNIVNIFSVLRVTSR